uniref:4-nitrophenylphosphatase n=1 Tax=Steinernema glaseri TaxID=37863 RepID=A0A1I7ZNX2_9BILA
MLRYISATRLLPCPRIRDSRSTVGRTMSSVTRAVRSSLLALYDTFIFDADGVLWLGGDAIPGSPEFVNGLIDAGKRVVIVTNNSTKTVDEYFEKTKTLGFKVDKESIVSPAVVTAHRLSENGNGRSHLPVYLLGTTGLAESLAKKGVE